jgi:hypothetical protein
MFVPGGGAAAVGVDAGDAVSHWDGPQRETAISA